MSQAADLGIADANVWVEITGRFDPDLLTARTGIEPFRVQKYGTPTRIPGRMAPQDRWSLRQEVTSADFGPALLGVLGQLELVAEALKELTERGAQIKVIFDAYVVGRPSSVIPNLYLDAETVRRLAALGVDVALDINLLEEDDPKT